MKNKFRFGAYLIAMLLAVSIFAQAPTSVYAAESSQELSDREIADRVLADFSQTDILTLEEMKEIGSFSGQFSALDATAFYETLASMDIEAFTQLKYELPTAVEQTSSLNYQYGMMQAAMESLGYGTHFEFDIPEMQTGYTNDITTAFTDAFGDLSNKYNETTSLPEGWSMKEIMSSAQSKRDEYASDIKTTKEYNIVKSNISNNASVSQAIEVIETPELQSSLSLQTLAAMKSDWAAKDEANKTKVQQAVTSYMNNSKEGYSVNHERVDEEFTDHTNSIKSWLNANHQNTSFTAASNIYEECWKSFFGVGGSSGSF